MTSILNITIIDTKPVTNNAVPNKKLWYDASSKKMIEIDGEIGFNYSKGELNVVSKNIQQTKSNKSNINVMDRIERDSDILVLGKYKYNNKTIITIEVSDEDKKDLCDMLDDFRVNYYDG
ncbi:hypothetical protein CMI47_23525 [Candidatus Pacearchaeota archaeon]|jgi:hypothetical protein|nr:hypothetical protein [Candidatus Pacearchaeota archaeon]|tara:strand:+ start:4599 stop:4958 length:360 start_codon:yes stop_codon:yes gene_type:complete